MTIKRIAYLVITLCFISCSGNTNKRRVAEDNTKPPNVDLRAKWVGGADGGVWVSVDSVISKSTLMISIYSEFGDIWLENQKYGICDYCSKDINLQNGIEMNGYDGDYLYIESIVENRQCYLEPVD